MDAVCKESIFQMGEPVEHLDSTVAVTNVKEFVNSSDTFDHFNIGCVIVETVL